MKAELRHLHSPDVHDLRRYQPETPTSFGVFVEAMIGIEGRDGDESFGFTVCSPAWLMTEVVAKSEGYEWSRALLVLPEYDYQKIESAVRGLCSRAERPQWDSVAAYLARYTLWEFEDYVPAREEERKPTTS